jgi:hypothetical protein
VTLSLNVSLSHHLLPDWDTLSGSTDEARQNQSETEASTPVNASKQESRQPMSGGFRHNKVRYLLVPAS